MKRTLSLCCAALLSCLMTCPALAADALLLMPSLYPTEVKEYANGEEMRLERTYLLSKSCSCSGQLPVLLFQSFNLFFYFFCIYS